MNCQAKALGIVPVLTFVICFNAYANPQGEDVVSGTATFDRSTPNTLTVNTSSNNTIINYNSFSIAADEATRFNQPSASSAVLNRVVGVDPSQIYGSLSSNGKLFLVNPNGIVFGPNSSVNAPAILASTLEISNSDFLNGNYVFSSNGKNSSILNQGRLAASPGGYIALLSQAVNNQGAIIASLGSVALAAGNKVTLSLDSQSQISVAVDDAVKNEVLGSDGKQIKNAIENSGTISANGGKVLLTAKILNDVFDHAVNNSGVIEARSMHAHDGVVDFEASGASIMNTGKIKASQVKLISDSDIFSLGVLQSSYLFERGNTFQVGGVFNPGYADIKNADNAIVYSSNTTVSGSITDPANIIVDPGVTLDMVGDTIFSAGSAFTMDPSSTIDGEGYNLSISAVSSSTLGNINNVNLLTLGLTSGSTPVTFTSSSSSTFQANTVKTNNLSSLSRSVGSGTSLDPIMIYSDSNAPGGLQYISTSGLGLDYQLANNIDASETSNWNSGAGFNPIGNFSTPFIGIFNGNNNYISNLFIDRPSTSYVAPFGDTLGATLSNIGFINVNITGQNAVGGLVGSNDTSSIINDSFATGTVSGTGVVGGLAGVSYANISNSYYTGSVSGGSYVGGLVGENDASSNLSDSYATGSVAGSGSYIGGLVGENNSSALIDNSFSTGSVTGGDTVGGLVGYNYLSSFISSSYATGAVSGSNTLGGLVGYNDSSTIYNSYATGSVTSSGVGYSGGLVGISQHSSSITNSFATGTVSGSGVNLGGLLGYDDNTTTLTNNWWYNSQSNGIGNNGTATSSGHWEKASGLSDFYGAGSGVGNLYSTWNFGATGGWNSFTGAYPRLSIEWSPTITSLLQLQNINLDLSGTYVLGNNINASITQFWNSGSGFIPIGNSSTPFTGTFDGNDYTISNLFIDSPSTDYVGLFGYGSGSTISNIGLTNVNITGQNYVGGLAGFSGYSSANISNAYAIGSVTGTGDYVGGLAGQNNIATISNSYTAGTVTGGNNVGGLVGWNTSASISDSYAVGSVTGSGNYVGGLTGENYSSSSISDSYATGTVTGNSGGDIGGLVGLDYTSSISDSYATGQVTGAAAVGGLIGASSNSSISNSYANGAVTGGLYTGGLVGQNNVSSISNSYATGAVYGSSDVGGLVGENYNASTVSNSFATGAVSGSGSNIGGLIGYDDVTNTITNNWWYNSQSYGVGSSGTAQSTGNWQKASGVSDFYGTGSGVGSLYSTWDFTTPIWNPFTNTYPHLFWEWSPTITTLLQLQNIAFDLSGSYTLGNSIDATITQFWNSGSGFIPIGNSSTPFTGTFDGNDYTISNLFIDSPSTDYVGLFGYGSGSTISNIGLTNVNITGQNYVGGLAGFSGYSSANISNAYAIGSVTGTGDYVGGLAGQNNIATISNSYTAGTVTGGNNVGGLVGWNTSASISDSYAVGSVTGSGNYVGGLTGANYSYSSISNSYATGLVTASSGGDIGGLAGLNYTSSISGSYATGQVTGAAAVGGLIGASSNSSISNSYANGAVTGGLYTGGLVGQNNVSSISNSYATGAVYGSSDVGGLVGENYNASTVSNSFATGAVSGSGGNIGGIIGYDDGSNTLTDNWWYNSQTYGIGSNGTAQSTGNWQKASGVSDFYGTGSGVGNLYSTWSFGVSGGWDSFVSTCPHLYWEWSPTITTLLQLQNINLDLSGNYTLANNIDAIGTEGWNSGAGFIPLGNLSTQFTGTFNGGGNTISNLFILAPSTDYVGLFGLTQGSTISNVGLTNVNINGHNDVGGLVGANSVSSAVSNSYVSGVITGYGTVGGLLGGSVYNLTNSYANVSVTGRGGDYIGGLIGENTSATISNSYATGSVTGYFGNGIGGLVGYNAGGTVSNAYSTGSVAGNFGNVGGLIGINISGTISNSYSTASAVGPNSVGGLVGHNASSSSILNAYSTGSVASGINAGGLIGYDDGSNTLTNNWWYSSVANGIGNNGSATDTGHWELASGLSDFYNSSFYVYTGSTPWDFTTVWYPPSSSYPLLR